MTENEVTQPDQVAHIDNSDSGVDPEGTTENVSTASTDPAKKDHTTRNIIIAAIIFLLLLCCCCFLLTSAFVASGVLDPYLDQLNLGVGLIKYLPLV